MVVRNEDKKHFINLMLKYVQLVEMSNADS